MKTEMTQQSGKDLDAFMSDLTGETLTAAARARLEFRADREAIEALGVCEFDWIRSRLIDGGLDGFDVEQAAEAELAATINAPGLVVQNPTGNEVGSAE